MAGGVISLAAAFVAIALLVKGLYPTDLPASRNPDFIDNIFDNRGVLWAARMLLVSAAAVLAFGGIFIVVSIGIRMKNGSGCAVLGPLRSPSIALVVPRRRLPTGIELPSPAMRKSPP
jgi:hypothetical protein